MKDVCKNILLLVITSDFFYQRFLLFTLYYSIYLKKIDFF